MKKSWHCQVIHVKSCQYLCYVFAQLFLPIPYHWRVKPMQDHWDCLGTRKPCWREGIVKFSRPRLLVHLVPKPSNLMLILPRHTKGFSASHAYSSASKNACSLWAASFRITFPVTLQTWSKSSEDCDWCQGLGEVLKKMLVELASFDASETTISQLGSSSPAEKNKQHLEHFEKKNWVPHHLYNDFLNLKSEKISKFTPKKCAKKARIAPHLTVSEGHHSDMVLGFQEPGVASDGITALHKVL